MTWLRVLAVRLRALFPKARLERELDEDLHSHLEMLVQENVSQGMSPKEARYAALRSFGGTELAGYLPARRAAQVDPMVALREK